MAQWWWQALGNTCPLDVPASPEGLISAFMEQSSGAAAVVCPGASPNQSPCVRSVAPAGVPSSSQGAAGRSLVPGVSAGGQGPERTAPSQGPARGTSLLG